MKRYLSFLALAATLPALAQVTADTEEQRRRAQQETEARERAQRAPRVQVPAPAAPADPRDLDLPAETPCFPIANVRLEGSRLDAFPWLQRYLDNYRDRCLGREGIDLIVKRGTALLIERGLVTSRIGIPEQDLGAGTLRLALVPGIVRAIRFADPDNSPSWRSAFPARPGDLLNLRDLEQGLEQLKRVPSLDADMQIVPGEAPGESDVVVTLKRTQPWRLSASLDDAGTKPTGKLQAALNLSLDNPLGLNDLLTVGLNSDAAQDAIDRGTRGDSFSWSLPWGYWTFSLAANRSRYRQTVRGVNQRFVSSGESEQTEAKIHRVFFRDQAAKTALQLRLIHRHSRSFIEDAEILVQRRNTTAAELALVHRQYLGPAQLDLTLARKEGVPWLGGQSDPANRVPGAPTHRYALDTLDLAGSLPFKAAGHDLRWLTAWRGQAAHSPLYAAEFFAIGGRHTVRGFDGEQTLSAERGWYWRNELELPFAGSHAAYAALDQGRVGGPSAPALAGTALAGLAVGLRGSAAGVGYDLFAGWPLRKPAALASARPALGAQLTYQF